MAKAYGTRPSVFLGLTGLAAYHMDRAVLHFGEGLEAALEKAHDPGTGRTKPSLPMIKAAVDRVYAEWLQDESLRKFRSV